MRWDESVLQGLSSLSESDTSFFVLTNGLFKPVRISHGGGSRPCDAPTLWRNTIEDKYAFNAAVSRICYLYQNAPKHLSEGTHTVCTDEKTCIQALGRTHPDMGIQPGKRALPEFDYIRHETQALIPTFEVATGK